MGIWALMKNWIRENKSFVLLVGIASLLFVAVAYVAFSGEDPVPEYAPEEISEILDNGTCTANDATSLKARAEATEGFAEKAMAYEQLVNCYIQHTDYANGSAAAKIAEENYTEAGLVTKAIQMGRSARLLESIDKGEPEQQVEDSGDASEPNPV